MPDVAGNIRRVRRRRRLTQPEVAAALGIELAQFRRYESGAERITPILLAQLARLFNSPVSAFFRDQPPPRGKTIISARPGLLPAWPAATPPWRR